MAGHDSFIERVVIEKSDQVRYGRSTQEVVCHKAVPEYLRIIPMRPTSHWPSECFNKFFVNVRKLGQHCPNLLNHRRQWSLLTKCSNMRIGHLEANPSFWLGVAGVLSTGDSAFPPATLIRIHNTIDFMVLSILFHAKMDILHGSDFLSRVVSRRYRSLFVGDRIGTCNGYGRGSETFGPYSRNLSWTLGSGRRSQC